MVDMIEWYQKNVKKSQTKFITWNNNVYCKTYNVIVQFVVVVIFYVGRG